MRATDLHQYALRAHESRREDWLAIVVLLSAFFFGLFVLELVAISVLDWLEGRPHSVLPALQAFLETLDGGFAR